MEKKENQEIRSYDNLPPEDEIDLADLVGVLYRQRWVILGITLVITLLGLGYGLLSSKQYGYQTLIEVGQLQTAEGEYKHVESPKAAKQRLDASARTVYKRLDNQAGPEGLKFGLKGLTVEASEEGGVLEMSMEALQEAEIRPFMETLTDRLKQSHNLIFAREEQSLRQKIQETEARLKNLGQNIETYKRSLKNLEEERSFLKEQIGKSADQVDQLLKIKTRANFQGNDQPVGLLLFSSEIQRARNHIDELRGRLVSEIPEKEESLQVKLDSTRSKISGAEAELESQHFALDSIDRTDVLMEPTISDNPVAPNMKLTTALGLVLGLFMGIFLAFLWEFWVNNRERISRSPENSDDS